MLSFKPVRRVLRQPTFGAVGLIEKPMQQSRPLKVGAVRCGFDEDWKAAQDRHFAAHPKDRGADVVILPTFYDDEELADESQVCTAPARPACIRLDVEAAGQFGNQRLLHI